MSDKEAIEYYKKTGKNLGVFNDIQSADRYAQELHKQQQSYYKNNSNKPEISAKKSAILKAVTGKDISYDEVSRLSDVSNTDYAGILAAQKEKTKKQIIRLLQIQHYRKNKDKSK